MPGNNQALFASIVQEEYLNQAMREAAEPGENAGTGFEVSHSWRNGMAEHSFTPNDERSVSHRAGDIDRAVGQGQVDHVQDPWTGPGHSPILLRSHRLDGRGNGSTRAQHIQAMQRAYGNAATLRAVQRQVENSSMESIIGQWVATGQMGEALGQAVDFQQNQAHDKALGDAQSAITGRPPEWPTIYSPMTGPVPVPLHEITYPGEGVPQYTDVSPKLNFDNLTEMMYQADMMRGR